MNLMTIIEKNNDGATKLSEDALKTCTVQFIILNRKYSKVENIEYNKIIIICQTTTPIPSLKLSNFPYLIL